MDRWQQGRGTGGIPGKNSFSVETLAGSLHKINLAYSANNAMDLNMYEMKLESESEQDLDVKHALMLISI